MSLSNPTNPPLVNEAVAKPVSTSKVFGVDENQTKINQIHGITPNNSSGAGIPKQVTNVQASMANGSPGATSTVNIQFRIDPSDKAFSGVKIFAKGYQGNNTPVQVGSSTGCPATVILNNTGESVNLIVQAYGNGGVAPLSQCPSASIKLPLSSGGGAGTTSVTQIVTVPSSGTSSLSLVSNTLVQQGVTFGAPTALNVSTDGTYDWLCCSTSGLSAFTGFSDPQTYRWKKSRTGLWVPDGLSWNANSSLSATWVGGAFSVSANSGDDAGLGNGGTDPTFPLTNNTKIIGAFQNITTVVPQGYSWTLRIPIYNTQRTINIYHGNRAQLNKTALSTITAHMMDGSVADVTASCPNAGSAGGANIVGYKTVLQAKAASFCYLMITSVFTSTGATGNTGDALLWCAVTMS